MVEVQFHYKTSENQEGVLSLNRYQYEGICMLNQNLTSQGYKSIELEEVIPLTKDEDQLKDLIRNQANRIIQNTTRKYRDEYPVDLIKDVIRDKFYHKFDHPTFLFHDLLDTQLISREEIENYKKKRMNTIDNLLKDL